MKTPKFTVQYFIDKFEKIPDSQWTIGVVCGGEKRCALGWCDVVEDNTPKREWVKTDEANALERIFNPTFNPAVDHYDATWRINDRMMWNTEGETPKERMVNALKDKLKPAKHKFKVGDELYWWDEWNARMCEVRVTFNEGHDYEGTPQYTVFNYDEGDDENCVNEKDLKKRK